MTLLFWHCLILDNKFYDSGAPSSDKISLRNYITRLCKTDLCVDNLILYLNGPVRSDGSILLQDLNLNGEVISYRQTVSYVNIFIIYCRMRAMCISFCEKLIVMMQTNGKGVFCLVL